MGAAQILVGMSIAAIALALVARATKSAAPPAPPAPPAPSAPTGPGAWQLPTHDAIPAAVVKRAYYLLGAPWGPKLEPDGYAEVVDDAGAPWTPAASRAWRLVRQVHNDGPSGPKPYDHPGTTVFLWVPKAVA